MKNLSTIGICRKFILGVMTAMWFVLISIQSAAVDERNTNDKRNGQSPFSKVNGSLATWE